MVEVPARRLLRREERQASILHGAAAAFARSGFAATSMEDVGRGVRRHQAHRVPPLRLEGGALPGDPPARVRPAGRGARPRPRAPVRSPGLGARTLLTVAREDPAAFTLLWRHAPREAQFAAYALELRAMSVRAVRDLMAIASGDAAVRRVERRGRDRLARGGGARVARGRRRSPRRRHGQVGHRGPASDARRLGRLGDPVLALARRQLAPSGAVDHQVDREDVGAVPADLERIGAGGKHPPAFLPHAEAIPGMSRTRSVLAPAASSTRWKATSRRAGRLVSAGRPA